jgi:hypothetical protein
MDRHNQHHAAVLSVLYFVYEQERKKLTTARELEWLEELPRKHGVESGFYAVV